jgi:hypothetical protein
MVEHDDQTIETSAELFNHSPCKLTVEHDDHSPCKLTIAHGENNIAMISS